MSSLIRTPIHLNKKTSDFGPLHLNGKLHYDSYKSNYFGNQITSRDPGNILDHDTFNVDTELLMNRYFGYLNDIIRTASAPAPLAGLEWDFNSDGTLNLLSGSTTIPNVEYPIPTEPHDAIYKAIPIHTKKPGLIRADIRGSVSSKVGSVFHLMIGGIADSVHVMASGLVEDGYTGRRYHLNGTSFEDYFYMDCKADGNSFTVESSFTGSDPGIVEGLINMELTWLGDDIAHNESFWPEYPQESLGV